MLKRKFEKVFEESSPLLVLPTELIFIVIKFIDDIPSLLRLVLFTCTTLYKIKENLFSYWYMNNNIMFKDNYYAYKPNYRHYRHFFIPKLLSVYNFEWKHFLRWLNKPKPKVNDKDGYWLSETSRFGRLIDDVTGIILREKFSLEMTIVGKYACLDKIVLTPVGYGILRYEIRNCVLKPFMVYIFEGYFIDGKLNGEGLIVIYTENESYQECSDKGIVIRGNFKDNEPVGIMNVKWEDGSHYKGELYFVDYLMEDITLIIKPFSVHCKK